MIEVADRGVGIRPEIREHIFERGVTTKTRSDPRYWTVLAQALCITWAGGTIEVAGNAARRGDFHAVPASGMAIAEGTHYAS